MKNKAQLHDRDQTKKPIYNTVFFFQILFATQLVSSSRSDCFDEMTGVGMLMSGNKHFLECAPRKVSHFFSLKIKSHYT